MYAVASVGDSFGEPHTSQARYETPADIPTTNEGSEGSDSTVGEGGRAHLRTFVWSAKEIKVEKKVSYLHLTDGNGHGTS